MVKKPKKAARKPAGKSAKKSARKPAAKAARKPIRKPAKKVTARKPAKLLKDQTPHWHDCDVDVKVVRRQAGLKPAGPMRMGLRAGIARWRVANALEKLRKQLNTRFPNRSKASDGGIGDPNHQSRNSDHNPWVREGGMGIVTARDFTHDRSHGCDCNKLAESIRAARDGRVKYIIWNRRICTSFPKNGKPAWAWRPYTGVNGHTHHLHLSVKPAKSLYDSESAWSLGLM